MSRPDFQSPSPAPEVINLVATALDQEKRTGLSEMLRSVAQAVDAVGCILWQEVPDVNQLFVLADGFLVPERSALHNLSLLQSATGLAIRERKIVAVDDVNHDPRVYRHDPFFQQAGIRCFCSVPLVFTDGKRGALNSYRNVVVPFSRADQEKLAELAVLLPRLYEAIIDKVSYRLILGVNQFLQAAHRRHKQGSFLVQFKKTASKICRCIAASFDVLEVSLFLGDPLEEPGVYRLAATTWPERRNFAKPFYRADPAEGLTGWVLACRKALKIFDLAQFERERYRLQAAYPGVVWRDSLDIENSVHRILRVPPDRTIQPISFMAVPLSVADDLLGALRCCIVRSGPFYFSDRDLSLLSLVADQIAHAWNDLLNRKQIEEESRTWKSLVDSVRDMNRFVAKQVSEGNPRETSIFEKALEVTNSAISGAEILDVRLVDSKHEELYFEATYGAHWQQGKPTEISARRKRRFRIDESPPTSGGAYVIQKNETYVIANTADPRCYYSETFADARRMIIAPIGVAGKVFGVLDIRGTGERVFPRYGENIAELLGQQLGLYHYLVTTISELKKVQLQQAQALEDFAHQLKSPILQVHARTQRCVHLVSQESCPIELLRGNLFAIRGLASKARRVGQGLRLFTDLARENKIRLSTSRLYADSLVKALVELAMDHENIGDPEQLLRFQVLREGFDSLSTNMVVADFNLLLQAVNNILDNAGKYSFRGSTVIISGGLTGSNRFHITVINRGIPISADDVRSVKTRGWRSTRARAVTGEGSGIGLWIVSHILMAHNGELLIFPTTPEGYTEIKLVLPAEAVKLGKKEGSKL